MGKFLGLDSSTQSLTGILIDTDLGRIEWEESVSFDEFGTTYGVTNGVLELGEGRVHSFPLMWAEALDLLFDVLTSDCDLSELRAIAGSGQQHGTVYLNDRAEKLLGGLSGDQPLVEQLDGMFSRKTAPIWMDTSSTAQCREIEEAVGGRAELVELTGNTAFERFSGPQIRKFFQEEPSEFEQTSNISLISSYVASLLAGKLVGVDSGDGSGTNMMDIARRQWSARALDATAPGLMDRLLPIADATRPAGNISPYYVERYGFSEDCLVMPFSGDNPCSMIGLGLVEPGRVALSLGTSDTLFACMDAPHTSAKGEGAVFASPDEIHYMALICFLNGSLAREAVRDQFGLNWQGFSRCLAATPVGNNGAMMLPYFAAEIVLRVAEPGPVIQSLQPDDAAGHVRAVIEAQAMSSKLHSAWMGVPISALSVTGGASSNREILQVYANVHGCPVYRFETTNSAALGAALRAAYGFELAGGRGADWVDLVVPFTQPVAGTTVEPEQAASAVYDRLLSEYCALEEQHSGKPDAVE